ncbi:MAG TPA: hypothetical protein VF223_13035 [Trebonia sp.]
MPNTTKHKFQSAKPDGLDNTLVQPSDWNEEHVFTGGSDGTLLMRDDSQSDGAAWVNGLPVTLTNRTGEQLVAGDVVNVSGADDASVVYTDVQGSLKTFLVAQRTINDLADGPFIKAGRAPTKVSGDVTRGNWLRKSAVNAALEDTGVPSSQVPPHGTLAIALEPAVGPGPNVIDVMLLGLTYVGVQPHMAVFTSSGTFTVPENVTHVRYVLQAPGGGAGGGGGDPGGAASGGSGGGGGGAGEYLDGWVAVTPGESVSVTVGAAGAGAPATGDNQNGAAGTAGGNVVITGSFGTITARGGNRGTGGGASGGAPGTGGAGRTIAGGASGGGTTALPGDSITTAVGGGDGGIGGTAPSGTGAGGGGAASRFGPGGNGAASGVRFQNGNNGQSATVWGAGGGGGSGSGGGGAPGNRHGGAGGSGGPGFALFLW